MRIENLKNELIGFEGTCLEVDNKMIDLGFYDEYESYTDDNIKSGCISYVCKEDTDYIVVVEFEIIITHGEDEDITASCLRITGIR